MTDLLSILCEAAGDFDELEDPRRAKKPKLGVSAKVGAQTRPASQSRNHSVSRAGQGHVMNTSPRQGVSDPKTRSGVSGSVSVSASVQSPKARAMGVQLHSSSAYTRASGPTGLIFGFEDRDGGNGPSSPNGSLDSSSVTSAMDEGANGMEEVGSSSEDDEMNYGASGQLVSDGSGSMLGGSGSAGNALLNSKKRKRVTKQSSRRAKPLTVEILYQIFEKLGIQKENVNGTYKLVLPTLKSAECSSVYFAVTEWQCFRKRIMNHGFEIVHEQQSSWIRVRPNLASPDGRLIFEDLELRRRYGTPCKIKNARERNEIFELPVLELELSSFDEEQQLRSPMSSDPEDRLSQEKADTSRTLDAHQSFGANLGMSQQTLGNLGQTSPQTFATPKACGQTFGSGQQVSSHDDSLHSQPATSYEMYESAGDEQTDTVGNSDFNRAAQTIGLSFGTKRSKRRGGRRMSDGAVVGGVYSVQSHGVSSMSSSSSISDDDEDAMMMGAAFDEEGEVDEDERSTHSMSWQSADEETGSRTEQHRHYRRSSTEMREERGAASAVGRNGLSFGATPFSLASSPISSSSGISVPLASSWAAAGYIGTPRTTLTGSTAGAFASSGASPLSTSASNATSLASSLGNLPPTSMASSPLGSSPLITSFFSSINLSGTPHFNLPSFSSVVNTSTSPVLSNSLSESESNATEEAKLIDRSSDRSSPTLDHSSEHSDGHVSMDVDASPRLGEPTHQLEGALRHCFRLPLVARELLSNGHFSLSNGQFDIQVTMKHSPRAHSQAKPSNISFGPSSPLNTSPIPHFPPFSAVSGNTPQ